MKTQPFKIYEMPQMQCLVGTSRQYRLASKKKKNLKSKFNLPSKSIKKEEQTKPKVSRRKEILKIREEINRDEKIEEINKIKSSFLERVNKTGKLLNSFAKKRERIQITTQEMKEEKSPWIL